MTNDQVIEGKSDIVKLAARAIEAYVREQRTIDKGEFPKLTDELRGEAGVFVCIKKDGELRGCIGTLQPTRSNIAEEVICNATNSCSRDPRFLTVKEDELSDLEVSVDVLEEPEKVSDPSMLDPKRYGVIVRSHGRVGLLLPDLEGVDDVRNQVSIAKQKAGIGADEPVELFRFTVTRYH